MVSWVTQAEFPQWVTTQEEREPHTGHTTEGFCFSFICFFFFLNGLGSGPRMEFSTFFEKGMYYRILLGVRVFSLRVVLYLSY